MFIGCLGQSVRGLYSIRRSKTQKHIPKMSRYGITKDEVELNERIFYYLWSSFLKDRNENGAKIWRTGQQVFGIIEARIL